MKKLLFLFVLVHFFTSNTMDWEVSQDRNAPAQKSSYSGDSDDFNPYEFCDQMGYEQFPSEAETTAPEMGLLMPSQFLTHSQAQSQIPEIGEIDEWVDRHDASLGDNSNDQNSQSDSEVLVDVDGSSQYGVQVSELQEPEYLNEADSTLKIPSKRLPEPSAVKECEQLEPKTKRAKTAVVLAATAQVHKQLSESSESEPEPDDSNDEDFEADSSENGSQDDDYSASASNEEVETNDSEDESSSKSDEELKQTLQRARAVLAKAAIAQTPKRGSAKAKHQCPHCEYKAPYPSNIATHIRQRHTGEKPFKCDYEGCEKTFATQSARARHKKMHTGEKPYACPYDGCDKKYTQLATLKTHIKVIHLQEKIECHECGRPFAYLSHLTLHIRREHTFERLYKCHDCHKDFFNSSNLRRHERAVHHKGC